METMISSKKLTMRYVAYQLIYFAYAAGTSAFAATYLLAKGLNATQVWHIYLIQLLQTFTYGFVYQPLYYMARRQISEADLVKGQAVAISMYTLGGACGSFFGGRMLDQYGITSMLWFALAAAFAGAVIINLSLKKEKQ